MPHKLDNLDNWTDFLKSVRYETDSRRNRNSDYLYNYHKNQIFFFLPNTFLQTKFQPRWLHWCILYNLQERNNTNITQILSENRGEEGNP